MPTADELQQDQDFIVASPSDQHAYLSATDPDYAKAPPADQTRYLSYVTQKGAPKVATPPNPIRQEIQDRSTAGLAAMPGGAPITAPATDTMRHVAEGGIGLAATIVGGPPAMRAVGTMAAKHPLAAAMIGSEAISQARKIPLVGRFIPPYSEMIPFLFGGGKGEKGAIGERDATLDKRNIPEYAGEERIAEPAAKMQSPEVISPPIARPSTIPTRKGLLLSGEVESPAESGPIAEPAPARDTRAGIPKTKNTSPAAIRKTEAEMAKAARAKRATEPPAERESPVGKKPPGTVIPQTEEESIDAMRRSIARIKKR